MDDNVKEILKSMGKSAGKTVIEYVALPLGFIIVIIAAFAFGGVDSGSLSGSGSSSDVGDFSDTSGDSFDQFVKYLHSWEGGDSTDGGKNYTVQSDGGGGYAVGHGVDIGTHGAELRKAGYSTSEGSKIPCDVVDAIEEREIQSHLKRIKSDLKGLKLKNYQYYALISRSYNCGYHGAIEVVRNNYTFKTAYKKFWNKNDDYYGNKDKVDYNHGLYTNYMVEPTTSNGKQVPGLVNRRKSEWLLFQTGFFDGNSGAVNEYCKSDSESDSFDTNLEGTDAEQMEKLIQRAKEIANDKDYQYYTYVYGAKGPKSFDCSGFVWYLYNKYFPNAGVPGSTSGYGTTGYLGKIGQVGLQPGDILYKNNHVELYIGNNKRAGAHTNRYPAKKQISVEKGGMDNFISVYRFVK